MLIKDKYKMTVEENVFYAKRNMVDSIWKAANLEGIAVTYPETEMLYDELAIQNMYIKDINAVINLKHAWNFILDNIMYDIDLSYIIKIHHYIAEANVIHLPGVIRTSEVNMGGTTWKPDIPDKNKVKEEIENILNSNNNTEKSIKLMLYLCRTQLFYDGNKRVALLAANQVMIKNGAGIISIPLEKQLEFKNLLITFYETNDYMELMKFIYNNCISGINFENDK